MSKDKYHQLVSSSNEDVSAASLISLNVNNIEDSDKKTYLQTYNLKQ